MKGETVGNVLALAGVALAAYAFLKPSDSSSEDGSSGSLGGQDPFGTDVMAGSGGMGGGGGGSETGSGGAGAGAEAMVSPQDQMPPIPGGDQTPDGRNLPSNPPSQNTDPNSTASSDLLRNVMYGAAFTAGAIGLEQGGKYAYNKLKKPKTPDLVENGKVKTEKDVMKTEGDKIQDKVAGKTSEEKIQSRKTVVDDDFSMSKTRVKEVSGKVETQLKGTTGDVTEAPRLTGSPKDAVRVETKAPEVKASKAGKIGTAAGTALLVAQAGSVGVETFQEIKPSGVGQVATTTAVAGTRFTGDVFGFISGLVYRPKSTSNDPYFQKGKTGWFASEREIGSGFDTLGKQLTERDAKGSATATANLLGVSGYFPKSWKDAMSEPSTINETKTELKGGSMSESRSSTTTPTKNAPSLSPKTAVANVKKTVSSVAYVGSSRKTVTMPSGAVISKTAPKSPVKIVNKQTGETTIIKKRYLSYAR